MYKGRVVLVDGNQYVSYLNGNPDNRNLNLNNADNEWNDNTWFLGLASESFILPRSPVESGKFVFAESFFLSMPQA